MRGVILFALVFTAGAVLAFPQENTAVKFCDNSGAPNKKNEVHKCACQQATRADCEQKPETNMPGCSTNCRPDACKCTPEKCS